MRGAFQVVVDEADSVLIDEAITPLIISEAAPDSFLNEAASEAVRIARLLRPKIDFMHDETLKTVELTPIGRDRLPQIAADAGPFWVYTRSISSNAIKAMWLKRVRLSWLTN
jgi:preprotein translocase subunit SecA